MKNLKNNHKIWTFVQCIHNRITFMIQPSFYYFLITCNFWHSTVTMCRHHVNRTPIGKIIFKSNRNTKRYTQKGARYILLNIAHMTMQLSANIILLLADIFFLACPIFSIFSHLTVSNQYWRCNTDGEARQGRLPQGAVMSEPCQWLSGMRGHYVMLWAQCHSCRNWPITLTLDIYIRLLILCSRLQSLQRLFVMITMVVRESSCLLYQKHL